MLKKILNDLIDHFSQHSSDASALFLSSHRCLAREVQIVDQKNKVALLVATTESLALVYDEVEEEFGVSLLSSNANEVSQLELVGDISQAVREMMRRQMEKSP